MKTYCRLIVVVVTLIALQAAGVTVHRSFRTREAGVGFGTELTGGTKRTVEFCKKHNRPYWVEDLNAPRETDRGLEVLYWLEAEFGEKGVVLNVAGPRESKATGIQMSAKTYVKRLIGKEQ